MVLDKQFNKLTNNFSYQRSCNKLRKLFLITCHSTVYNLSPRLTAIVFFFNRNKNFQIKVINNNTLKYSITDTSE